MMSRVSAMLVMAAALSFLGTTSGEPVYRCWTPQGMAGTCQSLLRCSRGADYTTVLQSIRSRLCYWRRGQPYICCPSRHTAETPREIWPTFVTIDDSRDQSESSQPKSSPAPAPSAGSRLPEVTPEPHESATKAAGMATTQPASVTKEGGRTAPRSKLLNKTELEKICGRPDPEVLADAESAQVLRQLYPDVDPLFAVPGGAFGKEARVTGGMTSVRGRWPWMAVIGRQHSRSNVTWLCGASIIDQYHLLTAAHCSRGSPNIVRVGGASIGRNERGGPTVQRRRVGRMTVHPRYRPPRSYHDLAVLTVRRPLRLGRYVRPVCLPSADLRLRRGQTARIAGHGHRQYDGHLADHLQEAEIHLVRRKFCNASYTRLGDTFFEKYPHGILSHVLCAGHEEGGVDACQGDSGGPLMQHDDTTNAYVQIGVISSGFGCGNPDYPGLYISTKHHLDFIEAVRANLASRLARRAQLLVMPRTRENQTSDNMAARNAVLPESDELIGRSWLQLGPESVPVGGGMAGSFVQESKPEPGPVVYALQNGVAVVPYAELSEGAVVLGKNVSEDMRPALNSSTNKQKLVMSYSEMPKTKSWAFSKRIDNARTVPNADPLATHVLDVQRRAQSTSLSSDSRPVAAVWFGGGAVNGAAAEDVGLPPVTSHNGGSALLVSPQTRLWPNTRYLRKYPNHGHAESGSRLNLKHSETQIPTINFDNIARSQSSKVLRSKVIVPR